jgi:hypothetical protein
VVAYLEAIAGVLASGRRVRRPGGLAAGLRWSWLDAQARRVRPARQRGVAVHGWAFDVATPPRCARDRAVRPSTPVIRWTPRGARPGPAPAVRRSRRWSGHDSPRCCDRRPVHLGMKIVVLINSDYDAS